MAKESYRQIKANRSGTRTSQADDDPDSGQRAGVTVDDLEDPGMSRIGKTGVQKAFHRILVDEREGVQAPRRPHREHQNKIHCMFQIYEFVAKSQYRHQHQHQFAFPKVDTIVCTHVLIEHWHRGSGQSLIVGHWPHVS